MQTSYQASAGLLLLIGANLLQNYDCTFAEHDEGDNCCSDSNH